MLEAIDMDSYRAEKRAVQQIQLADAEATIDPLPADGGGSMPEPELDHLSNILRTFNDQWGNITWSDGDRVRRLIAEEIPQKVAIDPAYQNARKYSDKQNARIEHGEALRRVIVGLMKDDTDLFRLFSDNPGFKRWLSWRKTRSVRVTLLPALTDGPCSLKTSTNPCGRLCDSGSWITVLMSHTM